MVMKSEVTDIQKIQRRKQQRDQDTYFREGEGTKKCCKFITGFKENEKTKQNKTQTNRSYRRSHFKQNIHTKKEK